MRRSILADGFWLDSGAAASDMIFVGLCCAVPIRRVRTKRYLITTSEKYLEVHSHIQCNAKCIHSDFCDVTCMRADGRWRDK